MNRPIKFRAWDNDNESYGYFDFSNLEKLGETIDSFRNYFSSAYFESNPGFLQQFTGLLDKNGKEIYEGDILDSNAQEYAFLDKNGIVTFEKGCFYACSLPIKEFIVNGIEVIGNIYENPNLLK